VNLAPSLRRPGLVRVLVTALTALLAGALLAPPVAWAAERVVGSGRAATEARPVGEFEAISLSGSIDIVVNQGPAASVSATADDNLLPLLETVIEPASSGPRLVVRWKSGTSLSTRSKAVVQVTTPRLVALASAGSGDARIESFSTPTLKVALSGSGNAAMPGLKTENLQIAIAGSGDVKTDGQASRLKVSVAGSGDVLARELRSDEVTVSIAGSGDVSVHAAKKLAVSIAGSGDVVYTGEPELSRSVAGSGSVRRR